MVNLKKHVKILSALSLASSDARKDTFVSVVIRTLYVITQCDKRDLSGYINEQFGFEPYSSELNESLEALINEGRILNNKNVLSLSDEERSSIDEQDLHIKDKEKSRFQNFKNFIIDELDSNIENHQIKSLWSTFLEYLYNSFFEYGEDALRTLHPHIPNGDKNGIYESILGEIIKKIKTPEEKRVFKEIIERFPDFASKDDISFLDELAQKTVSFSSLGFEPENAKETLKHDLVDWVLYLDTNVLYSLIDLHSHPENDSSKALIQLILDNHEHVKIKLRYSNITYKELGNKKEDFELLDDKLTDNSIKALLKSDNLDGFSKKFYENLLKNRDGTIHPSEAIELSQLTLKKKTIEIARNSKRIESLGEDYLETRVNDFYSFINKKNTIKMEFCENKKITYHPIFKNEKQAIHDITLRELLIHSRAKVNKDDETSLNSIKYFGVTLDDLLISYDRYQLRNYNDERSFPVFFKPSFLLNKLVRVLPIKTDDYKKAFIKAITSKGFHRESAKSRDVLKIVNYLKSQGIDDEKVVYNLISKDIFLEKYNEKSKDPSFNQGDFIESELNREFKVVQDKLGNTEEELTKLSEETNIKSEENKKLELTKEILEGDLKQYQTAINILNKRVKQLENQKQDNVNQGAINFEAENEKLKNAELTKRLKNDLNDQIEDEKVQEVKRWQRQIWWNLLWVIPLLFSALFFVLPTEINPIMDQSDRFKISGIIIAPIILIFLPIINKRYWSEKEKKDRKDNHILSDKLKTKLHEIEE